MRGVGQRASQVPPRPGAASKVRKAKRQQVEEEIEGNRGRQAKGRGTKTSTHRVDSLSAADRHHTPMALARKVSKPPLARELTGGPVCDVSSGRGLGSTSGSSPRSVPKTTLGHSQLCTSEAPGSPFPGNILSGVPGMGAGKLRSSNTARLRGNSASLDFPDLAKRKCFLPNAARVRHSYIAVILNYLPNLGVST